MLLVTTPRRVEAAAGPVCCNIVKQKSLLGLDIRSYRHPEV